MIDNYLDNIKNEIINGNAKVITKNYQINNAKLTMNYNIGKELSEAGKHYGEGIVKKYSSILTKEFGSGYKEKDLYKMQQFLFINSKSRSTGATIDVESLQDFIITKRYQRNQILY